MAAIGRPDLCDGELISGALISLIPVFIAVVIEAVVDIIVDGYV